MMANIWKAVKRVWFFLWGNLFTALFYKREILTGEWFQGKYGRISAPGWEWVYHDGWARLLSGCGKGVPWPVGKNVTVVGWENITFHPDDLRNFQGMGNYYQAMDSAINIGRGTWIAPGAGIIASNHDIKDPAKRQRGRPVALGEKCWIGMNAVILPGVTLGPHTVVGAGAVVTKSFPEGYCVIAGNPAKLLRHISKESEK